MAGYVPAHQKAKWSWKIVDAVKSMAPILVHEAASMPNATLTSQVLAIDPDGGDYAEEGEYEKYEKENVKKEKLDTIYKYGGVQLDGIPGVRGGDTILHIALRLGDFTDVIESLCASGGAAALDMKNSAGESVLALAVERNVCPDTLRTLVLNHGADPNIVDGEGNTALHLAFNAGRLAPCIKTLVEVGVDQSMLNAAGLTALDLPWAPEVLVNHMIDVEGKGVAEVLAVKKSFSSSTKHELKFVDTGKKLSMGQMLSMVGEEMAKRG